MRLSEQPARDRPGLLGEFVPRDAALALPGIEHVWHLADHIVLEDPRAAAIQAWLEG
jgi:hypothetical protein